MTGRQLRTFVALGFGSTHEALDAEALLMESGLAVVPIPAPSTLSADCGIALRLEPCDEERAVAHLAAANLAPVSRTLIEDV